MLCKCVCIGILVTVRAVISESSSDSNQAFGLSILTFSWLLSVVISSAVSGVTADPIGQYNLTLSSMCLQNTKPTHMYKNTSVCIKHYLHLYVHVKTHIHVYELVKKKH